MNSSANNPFSPYLMSRFHQHLNHLNDMAFAHTKILQEIMEKRSIESSSPPSSSSSSNDSRKRSYPDDNHIHKRPRKQPKPQQVIKTHKSDQSSEDEIGEINDQQNPLPPPPTLMPFPSPFLNYLENLQKQIFTPFPQTVHHHPYFSQMFFNNSYMNHPKKRRTKVTDTRLSPRIASKIPSDEETSSSDETPINGFQITKLMFFYTRYPTSPVLKNFFPDVHFNKLLTAQLVKWFSNFREYFYQQIEKAARQYLAEGIRNPEDLIVTTNCELYRALNLHYNRSNQMNVPLSFIKATQVALREFFQAIQQQKDLESSWKKSIYKIMHPLEDQIPEFFKSDHWMHAI